MRKSLLYYRWTLASVLFLRMFFKRINIPDSTTSSPCAVASASRIGLSCIIFFKSSDYCTTGVIMSRYWNTTVSTINLLVKLKSSLVTTVFFLNVKHFGKNLVHISFMK